MVTSARRSNTKLPEVRKFPNICVKILFRRFPSLGLYFSSDRRLISIIIDKKWRELRGSNSAADDFWWEVGAFEVWRERDRSSASVARADGTVKTRQSDCSRSI